jgi:hypothetical protein
MTHSVCSQMGDYDAALVVTFESYDDGGWKVRVHLYGAFMRRYWR